MRSAQSYAEMMGHPVRPVALSASDFKIDLDRLLAASHGAGLVFYCNPNNPTATYVGARATRDYLAQLAKTSPDTTVLIDEADFDYVTDPDHATHIPVAVDNPRVLVARTFSKAYGMAGLRIGYAVGHKDTIAKMAERTRDPARARSTCSRCSPRSAASSVRLQRSPTSARATRLSATTRRSGSPIAA